jgi:DNA-binding XRE family transcriptional regulator
MLDKSLPNQIKIDISNMKTLAQSPLDATLQQQAKHIGVCFARLRVARAMKQDVAAVRAGLSRNTAYRLESGDPGVAVGQLLRYLEAIAPGMSLHALLSQTDPSLAVLQAKEQTRRVRDLSGKELAELDF